MQAFRLLGAPWMVTVCSCPISWEGSYSGDSDRYERMNKALALQEAVAYPGILFGGGGGSTNSVEDRGQRERGSGGR